jgi:hypothetical protein
MVSERIELFGLRPVLGDLVAVVSIMASFDVVHANQAHGEEEQEVHHDEEVVNPCSVRSADVFRSP